MRAATVVSAIFLFALVGCSRSDQERAHQKTEEAKQEARKLGTEAEAKAKQVNKKLGEALDRPGGSGTAATESAEDKLHHAAAVAREEGRSAGKKLDHAGMVARVKAKLANDAGLATVSNVSVDVAGGVVTLSGTVASEEQKREAERAAATVDGVTKVVNQLTVSR